MYSSDGWGDFFIYLVVHIWKEALCWDENVQVWNQC